MPPLDYKFTKIAFEIRQSVTFTPYYIMGTDHSLQSCNQMLKIILPHAISAGTYLRIICKKSASIAPVPFQFFIFCILFNYRFDLGIFTY